MLNGNEWLKIAEWLGLRDFRPGPQPMRNVSGQLARTFKLHSFWLAEISYFGYLGNRGHLIVTSVQTSQWRKGLVLLPRHVKSLNLVDEQLPHPLDIREWDDPVTVALQSINLAYGNGSLILGSAAYSYTLTIGTQTLNTQIEVHGPTHNDSLDRLWDSLVSAVHYLTGCYNNDEMSRFIAPPKTTFD